MNIEFFLKTHYGLSQVIGNLNFFYFFCCVDIAINWLGNFDYMVKQWFIRRIFTFKFLFLFNLLSIKSFFIFDLLNLVHPDVFYFNYLWRSLFLTVLFLCLKLLWLLFVFIFDLVHFSFEPITYSDRFLLLWFLSRTSPLFSFFFRFLSGLFFSAIYVLVLFTVVLKPGCVIFAFSIKHWRLINA